VISTSRRGSRGSTADRQQQDPWHVYSEPDRRQAMPQLVHHDATEERRQHRRAPPQPRPAGIGVPVEGVHHQQEHEREMNRQLDSADPEKVN
jgi:hypothetical protein